MNRFILIIFTASALLVGPGAGAADDKISVLIVDGQNNHNWRAMTPFMTEQLEASGLFHVTVSTSPDKPPRAPKGKALTEEQKAAHQARVDVLKGEWAKWRPGFTDYDVVLSNYNGELWPEAVQKDFEAYVKNGGGVVIIHAANNAFTPWVEYNKMIGLGWRKQDFGKRVSLNDDGSRKVHEAGACCSAGHGSQHAFRVKVRDTEHPITRGMPPLWMHAKDELYHSQRGPAENMHIIASAWSDPETRGTGEHEPMVWEIPYGQGKVITNLMGHENGESLQCIGFVTLMLRSCEYVATGGVTTGIPKNFPTKDEIRKVE